MDFTFVERSIRHYGNDWRLRRNVHQTLRPKAISILQELPLPSISLSPIFFNWSGVGAIELPFCRFAMLKDKLHSTTTRGHASKWKGWHSTTPLPNEHGSKIHLGPCGATTAVEMWWHTTSVICEACQMAWKISARLEFTGREGDEVTTRPWGDLWDAVNRHLSCARLVCIMYRTMRMLLWIFLFKDEIAPRPPKISPSWKEIDKT